MFHIQTLEMAHWDFWQRFTLPLDAQIVTIIGPNGSGKTTLLDALRTLLALKCSGKRDYKRYVRNAKEPFAWLRGVVDNPKQNNGLFPYPFWPMTADKVTLACRIKKQGGDWVRHYCIVEGDVALEALDNTVQWLGVQEYRRRLEQAGLTPAIAEVLALEQGDTDKLCEYSPKALLDLVFQVFGDKEVLDNYQHAKADQRQAELELENMNHHLAEAQLRFERMALKANRYLEWRSIQLELEKLHTETLPRVQILSAQDAARQALLQYRQQRKQLWQKRHESAHVLQQADTLKQAIADALGTEQHTEALFQAELDAFQLARDAMRQVENTLKEQERLTQLSQSEHGAASLEQAKKLADARHQANQIQFELRNAKARRDELVNLQGSMRSGKSYTPDDVRQIRQALDEAGIGHKLLTEIVEVTDPRWQGAVEALLKPYRYLILLNRPQDKQLAWKIGERLRYRHFLVPDLVSPLTAKRGTVLEIVQFNAAAPEWLMNTLNRVNRVDNIDAGSRLGSQDEWITPEGYHRERRGARHIGVNERDFAFGEGARRGLQMQTEKELSQIHTQILQWENQLSPLMQTISALQSQLQGMDAVQMLANRQEEFRLAASQLPELQAALSDVAERYTAADTAVRAAREQRHALELQARDEMRDHTHIVRSVQDLESNAHQAKALLRLRLQALKNLKQEMPADWYLPSALAQLREMYESEHAVKREVDRLERKLAEEEWETDSSILVLRDKLKDDCRQQEAQVGIRQGHYERANKLTEDARGAYIHVLRTTVKRYGRNIKTLGALAGIEVNAEIPHLENDDVVLAQAGIAAQFNFDQKGMMGMNDGEASGGQQVMKSLILLIGLMMDDERPSGFVFIDEPFAHLDIFNIDRVSSFLQATQAQYLITTPNTHNVNVFAPSELTLVTRKKQPGKAWAEPVAVVRKAS